MMSSVEKMPNPVAELRVQLNAMEDQFKSALPAHMPVERFMRVVMTAIQNNPELSECERRSLWNAAMKAAQDGLLPDGREGAMVVRKDFKTGKKLANWQPMIAGIRKKARNSGEISTWDAHVVHENDAFEFELGDDPFIRHKPALENRGKIIAAYSICVLKDGEKTREVMPIGEIHAIRDRADAWKAFKKGLIKSTPWNSDEGEMCRKTVARRHSKVIPMSSDLDDLIRQDDDLYSFGEAAEDAKAVEPPRRKSIGDRLDDLVGTTGEVIDLQAEPAVNSATSPEAETSSEAASEAAEEQVSEDGFPGDTPSIIDQARIAAMRGRRNFDPWFNALSDEQKAVLKEEMPKLMAAAKQADQAKAVKK
jgi:recombination protein RecT